MVKHNIIFYKIGVILHACVHERRKDFSRGALLDFSKRFSREAMNGEIFFFTRN